MTEKELKAFDRQERDELAARKGKLRAFARTMDANEIDAAIDYIEKRRALVAEIETSVPIPSPPRPGVGMTIDEMEEAWFEMMCDRSTVPFDPSKIQ
ncbi:MAG: hypothetical protein WAM39_07600 [Bryobacteraceae bacterium]